MLRVGVSVPLSEFPAKRRPFFVKELSTGGSASTGDQNQLLEGNNGLNNLIQVLFMSSIIII